MQCERARQATRVAAAVNPRSDATYPIHREVDACVADRTPPHEKEPHDCVAASGLHTDENEVS